MGIIKWFGVIILSIRFGFEDRDNLWYTVSQSKYSSTPNFYKTGMSSDCSDMLWRHFQWIHQTDVQDEGTGHENNIWKIVGDFVSNFNEYCTHLFFPSDLICADEYILRWYAQGGHWINLVLPVYM